MEWIKNLKFSAILALAGVCVVLLGLSGCASVATYQVPIHSMLARGGALIIGLLLVAIAIWLEKPNFIESKSTNDIAAPKAGAQDVLHTLDDDVSYSFSTRVDGACRVSIFARTAVNLLNTYQHTLVELARKGTNVRLLCVDPASEACRTIYGGSHEIYMQNVQTTLRILASLKSQMGHRLEVRASRHAPTFGLTIIERLDHNQGSIDVQLYFLYSLTGRNRPILSIYPADKWYTPFMDEFNALWENAVSWDQTQVESSRTTPS